MKPEGYIYRYACRDQERCKWSGHFNGGEPRRPYLDTGTGVRLGDGAAVNQPRCPRCNGPVFNYGRKYEDGK